MLVWWCELGEVENECTSHNFSLFAIFCQMFIKISGNWTKFWHKQICTVFSRHGVDRSIVPSQCKAAYISPVPKVSPPQSHTDFHQISVTSVLTRIMERIIVRDYLYPALQAPTPILNFSDQFASRPTGSTTATLITILQSVTSLLVDNPYVAVIAVDLARHSTRSDMPQCWRKWHNSVYLIMSTTG